MKLLILNFLQKQKNLPNVLDQCKKYPNEPQLLPSEGKVYLKKCLWNKGYMHKW